MRLTFFKHTCQSAPPGPHSHLGWNLRQDGLTGFSIRAGVRRSAARWDADAYLLSRTTIRQLNGNPLPSTLAPLYPRSDPGLASPIPHREKSQMWKVAILWNRPGAVGLTCHWWLWGTCPVLLPTARSC